MSTDNCFWNLLFHLECPEISSNWYVVFTAWKVSNYEVFSGPYFPELDWIRRDTKCWVQMREIRTRKNPVFGNFSRSVLYYNLQFRFPILTYWLIPWNYIANTIDTAITRSGGLVVFCKTGVLTNFRKFTRKHLRQSLVFNEAAHLQSLTLSKKGIPTQMFSCQFCQISHNTIFKEPKKLSISAKERHRRCLTRF